MVLACSSLSSLLRCRSTRLWHSRIDHSRIDLETASTTGFNTPTAGTTAALWTAARPERMALAAVTTGPTHTDGVDAGRGGARAAVAEAFRAPEDGTAVRMIKGDPGRGAMRVPAIEDGALAADAGGYPLFSQDPDDKSDADQLCDSSNLRVAPVSSQIDGGTTQVKPARRPGGPLRRLAAIARGRIQKGEAPEPRAGEAGPGASVR